VVQKDDIYLFKFYSWKIINIKRKEKEKVEISLSLELTIPKGAFILQIKYKQGHSELRASSSDLLFFLFSPQAF
jgi:hypothetical protein